MPSKTYYVYILTNRSKRPFYTGMTNSIERRTWEHKNPDHEDFCARYRIDRLVYFEEFSNVIHAITREKQIKNMHRIEKMKLIVSTNPEWKDLSEGRFERHRYQPDKPIENPNCIDPEFAAQTQDDKSKG